MTSTLVIGRTAHHARGLAGAAFRRMALAALAAGLLLLAALLLYRIGSPLLPVVAVVGIPFAVAAAAQFSAARVKYLQARVGVAAEETVARALARLGGEVLLNGVLLGAGDIDHVLLGPWVLSVETKHARGKFTIDSAGRLRVGRRLLPRDPIGQASRNAEMLSRRLGVPVSALLVLSEADGRPLRIRDVWVLGTSSLPQVTAQLPRILPPGRSRAYIVTLPVADPGRGVQETQPR